VNVPVAVNGGIKFKTISAGGAYTCGISTANAAYCWGNNASAQLGIPSLPALAVVPTAVVGGIAFSSIHAGSGNSIYLPTCGISTGGDAYCWGYNNKGQVGSGSSGSDCTTTAGDMFACALAPVKVPGLTNVAEVDPGVFHTCAMLTDRRSFCWGDNTHGQLGDGTTTASTAPIMVKAFQ
jgi:alpha-tubulin suppressor-like RCC1 family protein